SGDNPELACWKQRFEPEFKAAFGEALASLTVDERLLLKQRYVDGLSAAALAPLLGLHHASVRRRLEKVRVRLATKTRRALKRQTGMSDSDIQSALNLLDSQFALSLQMVFEVRR